MDEIARRYLLLGLRLDRHVPGFVDSYVGPPELREAVEAEDVTPAESLHDEALRLAEAADGLSGDLPVQRRRDWFRAQLRAIGALARQASGEEIAYLDLVEQLFDVRVRPVPQDLIARALHTLDEALPGGGSLTERFQAFDAATRVPATRVVAVTRASAERFRSATARDFALPEPEEIVWDEAHDQPWGAEARFIGRGQTLVRLNVDLPQSVIGATHLAAHEGYPGHHLDHITKERSLIGEAGLGEATLRTMNTPESLLAEGLADVAREVVMSDFELAGELRRVAKDAGVEIDVEAALAIVNARETLQAAVGNAAILLHHDGAPAAEVRDYLAETTLQPPVVLDHLLRTLNDPIGRTYPFTYTDGARIIRAWLEVQGQTTGFARLLAEQHTPSGLIRESAVADG